MSVANRDILELTAVVFKMGPLMTAIPLRILLPALLLSLLALDPRLTSHAPQGSPYPSHVDEPSGAVLPAVELAFPKYDDISSPGNHFHSWQWQFLTSSVVGETFDSGAPFTGAHVAII